MLPLITPYVICPAPNAVFKAVIPAAFKIRLNVFGNVVKAKLPVNAAVAVFSAAKKPAPAVAASKVVVVILLAVLGLEVDGEIAPNSNRAEVITAPTGIDVKSNFTYPRSAVLAIFVISPFVNTLAELTFPDRTAFNVALVCACKLNAKTNMKHQRNRTIRVFKK